MASQQTSVSVVLASDDLQPMPKKVKTEPEDTSFGTKTTTGVKNKSRSDYKNGDLPVPADQKWTNMFMDTVILWAGGQSSIWSIPDESLATALQDIFSVVYPDVEHEVTIHGAVFGVVRHPLISFFLVPSSSFTESWIGIAAPARVAQWIRIHSARDGHSLFLGNDQGEYGVGVV